MRIDDIKMLVKLIETKSIIETAKKLKIAQPAVTMRLKKVEIELDRNLFVRVQKLSPDFAGDTCVPEHDLAELKPKLENILKTHQEFMASISCYSRQKSY